MWLVGGVRVRSQYEKRAFYPSSFLAAVFIHNYTYRSLSDTTRLYARSQASCNISQHTHAFCVGRQSRPTRCWVIAISATNEKSDFFYIFIY